jgi:putative addiction module CopG family antidote
MKVSLTPHQKKFVGQKMKGGGYLSEDEVIREALRVYELVEQEDNAPQLEAALRHSLRSPLKKYQRGHFAGLANTSRRALAA